MNLHKKKINNQYSKKEIPLLEYTYNNYSEFDGRTKKGIMSDELYAGIFAKTLTQKWGFTKGFLKYAEQKGILYKKYFAPEIKGTYKVGYLFIGKKLPQRTKFKKFIEKIWKLYKP